MTEKEFRDTSGLRDQLRALLLTNEVLKTAIEIVSEEAKPRGSVSPKPHAPLDTLVAHRYNRKAGIQEALDILTRLTEPNPVAQSGDNEDARLEAEIPFFHGLPDQMKEAYRKQLKQH